LIRHLRFELPVATALVLCLAHSAFALSWNDQQQQVDARFYSGTDRSFLGNGSDWSGIGVMQSGWVTMISDHYFLTSYHIGPPKADIPVDFYRTNGMDTSASNFVQMHIDPTFGEKIAGTDMWLGRMADAAPAWVERYPLIKRQDQTNWTSYLDPSIYVYGYSGGGNVDYVRSYLGTNTVNTFSNTYSDVYGSVGIGLTYTKDASGPATEAGLVPGDSSGPTFVKTPSGGLALTGLHWQLNQDGNTDTNVSAYVSQIVAATPEPINVVTDMRGDIDGDYRVTLSDVVLLANHFGASAKKYSIGDLNGDGTVNYQDFQTMLTVYGSSKFAPSDFNRDQTVDKADFLQIALNWNTKVARRTNGDANADGYVDQADFNVLNANWRFGTWTTSHPQNPLLADINQDGLVDDLDLAIWSTHNNLNCALSACAGADVNHDGFVNSLDYALIAGAWNVYGPADINHDLKVDNYDLSVVLSHWGQKTTAGSLVGDLNGDGTVNAADFSIMADWWGRGVGNALQQPALNVVPEPAVAMLSLIALLSGVSRRRR
jgi:hypothetical protein